MREYAPFLLFFLAEAKHIDNRTFYGTFLTGVERGGEGCGRRVKG